jgi:hypothetical protein
MSRALLLVVLASVSLSAQSRPRIATVNPGAVSPNPAVTILAPNTLGSSDTSTRAQTLSGTADDNLGVVGVRVSCVGQTTITDQDATLSVPNGTLVGWSYDLTLSDSTGSTTCTVTARDVSNNTGADSHVFNYTVAASDTTRPDCTLTTTSHTVSSPETTLIGVCSDSGAVISGLDRVEWVNTTPNPDESGDCTGTTAPSCSVTGLETGANTVQIVAYDNAGNSDNTPPSITVTYTPDLVWSTPASLGSFRTTDSTTRQLTATGGTGAITYAEVSDGGDVLGAGDCADITLAATGVLTISTPPTSGVTCSFTVRATDSAGSPDTADREFTLTVNDSAATSHAYFNTTAALTESLEIVGCSTTNTRGGDGSTKGCELRNQDQIEAIDKNVPGVDNAQWKYKYPSAASSSYCFGASCNDTFTDIQDGVKLEMPTMPCQSTAKCICATEPDQVCGGSDDPGGNHMLRFKPGSAIDTTNSSHRLLIIWDFWWDGTSWDEAENCREATTADCIPKKLFGLATMNQPDGDGSLSSVFELMGDQRDHAVGNGSGSGTRGTLEFHNAGLKLAAPGVEGYDPYYVAGQGAPAPGGSTPLLSNLHVRSNIWTRFFVDVQFYRRFSSTAFTTWRTSAATDADGKIALTGCTVSSGTATCTMASAWDGLKVPGLTPRFVAGETLPIYIENTAGTGCSGLNSASVWTLVAATDTTFTISSTGLSDMTCTGGTFDPVFASLSWWMADETRDATRVGYQIPVRFESPYVQFGFHFDTSVNANDRMNELYGYGRNVIMLKNYSLTLADASCLDTIDLTDSTGAANERGWCTGDVAANTAIFVKPVR